MSPHELSPWNDIVHSASIVSQHVHDSAGRHEWRRCSFLLIPIPATTAIPLSRARAESHPADPSPVLGTGTDAAAGAAAGVGVGVGVVDAAVTASTAELAVRYVLLPPYVALN